MPAATLIRQADAGEIRRAAPNRSRERAGFAARVISMVRRIPPGRVATYGDIAAWAGRPRASRAVGNIMRGCRDASVPAHRVVAAGGRVGGFAGNPELKRALLRAEGIQVAGLRVGSFERVRWRPEAILRRASNFSTRAQDRNPRSNPKT